MNYFPEASQRWQVILESAMLCFICPTATAAAVVTRNLGGDVPGITTYIVLINLLTAVLVPLVVPIVRPVADAGFYELFSMISAKVFPLLITPCLCAWLVRYLFPRIHARLTSYADLAFYLWGVALTLAIAVTVKSIINSHMSIGLLLSIALVSLACCIFHFTVGRYVGSRYIPRRRDISREVEERGRYVRTITAGQSIGQKNTVFAIWMGYTFMTPETAIIGGFYSIWHNIYNSRQLRRSKTLSEQALK
jgi:BASS family bile acid:Na+ symporter